MNTIKRFIMEEDGLETVEYAVMAALLIGGITVAVIALSGAITGRFTTTTATINTP